VKNKINEGLARDGRASEIPNISAKVAASPGLSLQPYPFRECRRLRQRVFDAFGPQRSYWGTDITNSLCQASYRQRITHFTEELSFPASDKDMVMTWPSMRGSSGREHGEPSDNKARGVA